MHATGGPPPPSTAPTLDPGHVACGTTGTCRVGAADDRHRLLVRRREDPSRRRPPPPSARHPRRRPRPRTRPTGRPSPDGEPPPATWRRGRGRAAWSTREGSCPPRRGGRGRRARPPSRRWLPRAKLLQRRHLRGGGGGEPRHPDGGRVLGSDRLVERPHSAGHVDQGRSSSSCRGRTLHPVLQPGCSAEDSSTVERHSVRDERDADGAVAVDTLTLAGPLVADAVQLRFRLLGPRSRGRARACSSVRWPSRRRPAGVRSPFPATQPAGTGCCPCPSARSRCTPTAARSGAAPPPPRWCWPTGRAPPAPCEPRVRAAVAGVYDWVYDGHGSWPFNTTTYAATTGLEAYVDRFTSLSELEPWIAASVPVVISYSWTDRLAQRRPVPASRRPPGRRRRFRRCREPGDERSRRSTPTARCSARTAARSWRISGWRAAAGSPTSSSRQGTPSPPRRRLTPRPSRSRATGPGRATGARPAGGRRGATRSPWSGSRPRRAGRSPTQVRVCGRCCRR